MKIIYLRKLEAVTVFLLICNFFGAMRPFGLLGKLLSVLSYPILMLLIAGKWKRFIYVATRDVPLIILVITALVSIYWSSAPSSTFTFGKGLLRSTLLGTYLATRYSINEQINLFSWVFGIIALLSLYYSVMLPSQGVDAGGLWRGVFGLKNHLGKAMALSSQLFFLQALSSQRYRWIPWAGFMLSVFLMLRSESKTSLAALVLTLFLVPLYKFLQQRHYKLQIVIIVILIFLCGAILVLIVINAKAIVESQGKDLTFSGRTLLWPVLHEYIFDKPWLGYGYEGFWETYGFWVKARLGEWAGHAHNGIYELLLGLGLLGFLLYMLSLMPTFSRAVKQMYVAKTTADFWPLQLLSLTLVIAFTIGGVILEPSGAFWITYSATAFSLSIPRRSVKYDK